MRIAYMSDLHLEFEPPDVKSSAWKALVAGRAVLGHPQRGPVLKDIVGADLVVLAGDVDLGLGGIAYADEVSRFVGCPVVYVAGNHEYYGHDLDHLQDGLREAAWKTNGRVLYLERDSVRLWPGGHSLLVHGCTLWTDYGLNGSPAADKALARHGMSDHRRISRNIGFFSPEHAEEEHRLSVTWLRQAVAESRQQEQGLEPARQLVVSHHAPLRTGLKKHSKGLEAAYMSDLEGLVCELSPQLWLHGHTHVRHVTPVGATLVASAPRGYAGHEPGALEASFAMIDI
jgi:DNA repair exonuclease SbcCD nuclease subunit